MKISLVLSSLLLSLAAWSAVAPEAVKTALSSQKDCGNFIRVADSKVILGFGIYWPMGAPSREAIPSKLTIIDTAKNNLVTEVQTNDSSIDVLSWNDRLFVLTYEGLEERSSDGLTLINVYPTVKINRTLEYKEHATRMVEHNNKLFISHGRFGVTIFDLATRTIEKTIALATTHYPLESQATSIAMDGNRILILMDSFSVTRPGEPAPFRGIMVMDADTYKIDSELDGMDPGADSLNVSGDELLISFMGMPISKFKLSDLHGAKFPRYRSYITKFGTPGHPVGAGLVDEKYYHSYFNKHPATPQDEQVITRIILSIDRKAQKL